MFNILNDILYKKTGEYLYDTDSMSEYSLYMMQRWISMYSNQPVEFLNSTTNIMYGVLDNQESYKFLLATLPKYKYSRIAYIKASEKTKKTKESTEDVPKIEESQTKLKNSMTIVFGNM
jgi:hypothetical protein